MNEGLFKEEEKGKGRRRSEEGKRERMGWMKI